MMYDDAVVRRQSGVAGDDVGLRRGVRADLAREREGGYPLGEATSDGDKLVAVGVDHLREKG
jgi:hypothetical protein